MATPGILSDPYKMEIARLENAIEQIKLGVQRTSGLLAGDNPPVGDELLQRQQQLKSLQFQQMDAERQLAGLLDTPKEATGPTMQLNQAVAGDPSNPVYGLYGYGGGAAGQGGKSAFNPSISPDEIRDIYSELRAGANVPPTLDADQLREVYGILAAGADKPESALTNYISAAQNLDTMRSKNQDRRVTTDTSFVDDLLGYDRTAAQNRDTGARITDAMRPRTVGGGFLGAQGQHINPIFDPNLNKGRGGMRYETGPSRMPQSLNVGGVEYVVNPDVPIGQPGWLIPAVDMPTATDNARDLNRAEALGTAQGTDQAGAQVLGGDLQLLDKRLTDMLNNPDFEGGVGLVDQYTGLIGAQFGTDEGRVTKDATYISNQLTRSSVKDWKGAISNAELNFFKDSVPQAGDGPQVWRDWYANVYQPTMYFVNLRATGQITKANSDLTEYLGGTKGLNDRQQELLERARKM